jgi:hypothetical protein
MDGALRRRLLSAVFAAPFLMYPPVRHRTGFAVGNRTSFRDLRIQKFQRRKRDSPAAQLRLVSWIEARFSACLLADCIRGDASGSVETEPLGEPETPCRREKVE